MSSLYGSNGEEEMGKCVELVNIIHKAFFNKIIEQDPTLLKSEKKPHVNRKLFKIPFISSYKATYDDNETDESTQKKSKKTTVNVNDYINKIRNILKDHLRKIKKDSDLNKILEDSILNDFINEDDEVKQSLKGIEEIDKLISETDKLISETSKILKFDLSKLYTEKNIPIEKKSYVENNCVITRNNEKIKITLKSYLKIKICVEILALNKKYEELEGLVEKGTLFLKEDKLKDALTEPRVFYVNKNEIKTMNFFVNFNGHKLKHIYKKFFGPDIISESIMKNLNKENLGFFLPDEFVNIFKRLSTNLVELNEDNLSFMVFNTNMCWFVLFTETKKDYDNFHSSLIKL